MSEYEEFWIGDLGPDVNWDDRMQVEKEPWDEPISKDPKVYEQGEGWYEIYHVIEKSAYDALKEENAKLREALESMVSCFYAFKTYDADPSKTGSIKESLLLAKQALKGPGDE